MHFGGEVLELGFELVRPSALAKVLCLEDSALAMRLAHLVGELFHVVWAPTSALEDNALVGDLTLCLGFGLGASALVHEANALLLQCYLLVCDALSLS